MNAAATTYPVEVLNILDDLANAEDWGDVWNAVSDDRDRELTETLCNTDACDFVVMVGQDAFLFASNDQTGEWEVYHVGQPVYEVEPEMIGDDTVDFSEFLKGIQEELSGVEVKAGSALNNHKSEFVQQFKDKLDAAFQTALENL